MFKNYFLFSFIFKKLEIEKNDWIILWTFKNIFKILKIKKKNCLIAASNMVIGIAPAGLPHHPCTEYIWFTSVECLNQTILLLIRFWQDAMSGPRVWVMRAFTRALFIYGAHSTMTYAMTRIRCWSPNRSFQAKVHEMTHDAIVWAS